jgi:hypothetical protein
VSSYTTQYLLCGLPAQDLDPGFQGSSLARRLMESFTITVATSLIAQGRRACEPLLLFSAL